MALSEDPPCQVEVEVEAPATTFRGQTVPTRLILSPQCRAPRYDVHLVFLLLQPGDWDDSGDTMAGLAGLADAMLSSGSRLHAGAVSTQGAASTCPLTDEAEALKRCLGRIVGARAIRTDNRDSLTRGMIETRRLLTTGRRQSNADDVSDVVLIVGQEPSTEDCGATLRAVRGLKTANALVVTLRVGNGSGVVSCLRQMATSPRYHFSDAESMRRLFLRISSTVYGAAPGLTGPTDGVSPAALAAAPVPPWHSPGPGSPTTSWQFFFRRIEVALGYSATFPFIPDTAEPPATIDRRPVRLASWDFRLLTGNPVTITFEAVPLLPGLQPLFEELEVTGHTNNGAVINVKVDPPEINVAEVGRPVSAVHARTRWWDLAGDTRGASEPLTAPGDPALKTPDAVIQLHEHLGPGLIGP